MHNRETTYTTYYSTYAEFEPGYRLSQEEIPAVQEAMEAAYQQVVSALPTDASDYDRAKAVYEYVIRNTEYVSSPDDQSLAGVFGRKGCLRGLRRGSAVSAGAYGRGMSCM